MMSYSMLVDLTISLLEENKHMKEALKKKDDELKAVRHYFNECVEDLKKAHAEIEILKKNPPQFILTDDESFESLEEKIKELNPLVMSSDNASIVCIDADKIKAEAIKECLDKFDIEYCKVFSIPEIEFMKAFKRRFLKEMVGDTE